MSRNDDADRRAWLDKERDRLRAYRATAKGKAALVRYRQSRERRASLRRYNISEKGRRAEVMKNARKIWIGRHYHSMAKTPELRMQIQAHIRSQLHGFKSGQSKRAQMETLAPNRVPPEARTRAD
jgi:hypothetical protein